MKPFNYILIAGILVVALAAFTWWLFQQLFRDGIGPTGAWDDEGGAGSNFHPTGADVPYRQMPVNMRHFQIHEFDSPDVPGSGDNMKVRFLEMIDTARQSAGIPFKVNSGYRTTAHNKTVGGVSNSAHLGGYAADIKASTLEQKIRVVRAARNAGFNRFGIYNTFIHLDCDPTKEPNLAWSGKQKAIKKGGSFSGFPFDPFKI